MGAYWHEDDNSSTPLGKLVAAAKDHHSDSAVASLQAQFADFVTNLELPLAITGNVNNVGSSSTRTLVVPVPSGLASNHRFVSALATSVAAALGATLSEALQRRNPTVRLRDTPVEQRQAIIQTAGYELNRSVKGHAVALVDDVVLTGTTLNYLADLLLEAGATSVIALVVARTRLARP